METSLSEIGILQAQETGAYLRNTPIDLIYCSDLKRTCQTANEIANRNHYIMNRKIQSVNSIIKSSTVRERSVGVYTGWSLNDWRNELKSKERSSKSWVPPEGESINQLRDRVIHSFSDLCQIMLKQESKPECNPCPLNISGQSGECRITCAATAAAAADVANEEHMLETEDRLVNRSNLLSCCSTKEEYLGHLVLMSHGGFINQLINYLASINTTPFTIDYKHIPNCSITQLSVIFLNNAKAAQVNFHSINFTDHLTSESFAENG